MDTTLLPSRYSVWPSTAYAAGTVACAVSTHCADHALVQLPLVHAWLAHHALLFLLFQLVLQVFIHGCGHALHAECYKLTPWQKVLHFAPNKNSKGIYEPQYKVGFYVYLSYLSLPGSWTQCLCHTDPCCSPRTSTLRHSWSEHMYGPYPWQPELQSDLSDLSPDL